MSENQEILDNELTKEKDISNDRDHDFVEFSIDSDEEEDVAPVVGSPLADVSPTKNIMKSSGKTISTDDPLAVSQPVSASNGVSSSASINGTIRKQPVSVKEDPLTISTSLSPLTHVQTPISGINHGPSFSKADAAASVASIVSKTTSTFSSFASKFQDAVHTTMHTAAKVNSSHSIPISSTQPFITSNSEKNIYSSANLSGAQTASGASHIHPSQIQNAQIQTQQNSNALNQMDDSKRRDIILSAIGSLLPGENVSMFLTHLRDVKDTASSHTGIGTEGFGYDSSSKDVVWCCLLTFYRIAIFSFKESEFSTSSIATPCLEPTDKVKDWLESASVSRHFQYMYISQKKGNGKTHHVLQMPISSVERIEKFSGTIQINSQLYSSPIPMMSSGNIGYTENTNELMSGGTIILYSKDNGRFIQFSTDSHADFNKAYSAIHSNAFPGRTNLAYLYAFEARRSEVQSSTKVIDGIKRITSIATPRRYDPVREFNRMIRIDDHTKCPWQPYLNANANYSMCPSYPSITFGPSTVDDKTPNGMTLIRQTAAFRSGGRMPTLVWASRFDGASIWRSSQPRVGFQGNRSAADELFIKHIGECAALANAQAATKGNVLERPNIAFLKMLTGGNNESDLMLEKFVESDHVGFSEKCLVKILDLRPKSSAVANRTQGYGYENTSYYKNTTLSFHGIGNIHAVRDSYQKLNALCNSSTVHDAQWMQLVEETKWLSSIRAILSASWQTAFHVRYNRLPVLLHCSHGWDRTSQVSALSQLLLDPFYRTRVGFSCLVEKEFVALGHPFRLRSGHGERRGDKNSNTNGAQLDEGQLSPIFIQFLDCVFQIVNQYPNFFEFNTKYLLVISDHVYSCRFGTFLTDTEKERELFYSIRQRTHCLWEYLDDKSELINPDYKRPLLGDQEHEGKGALLMPLSSLLRNVSLWTERHCMYSAKATFSPFPYGCMANESGDIFIRDTIQGRNTVEISNKSLEKEIERWKMIAEDKENELLVLRKKLKEREEEDQITKLSIENEVQLDGFSDVQDFVNDLDKL